MRIKTLIIAAAGLAGAALVSGCTEGRGYGGTSVAVGYNASYGDPYWGWYGDYYYPGTGIYVYDNNRRRTRWSVEQQGYWEGRRTSWRGGQGRHRYRSNWGNFRRR